MKIKIQIIFIILSVCAWADLPLNDLEYTKWESRLLQKVKLQITLPPDEAIPQLGTWVRQLSNESNLEKGDRPVFRAAQSTLLAIPGHAIYYQNKIESMRAEALINYNLRKEAREEKRDEGFRNKKSLIEEGDYISSTTYAFRTLKYLPSPETVAVLGYFLNDPEGRDPEKGGFGQRLRTSDASRSSTNSELAVTALTNLGIEHPPIHVQKDHGEEEYWTAEEIDAWKDWWNEIATGKRTYRFIGSDVEYGPNGPVSKDKLERIHQDRQRDAERAIGNSKPGDVKAAASVVALSRPLPLAGILATAILAVSGGWYFLKRRKAA